MHFTWDGSYLGEYPKSCLLSKWTVGAGRGSLSFYTLGTTKTHTCCHLKMTKNAPLRCLLDELKPVFGLEKIGTHHIRVGGRMYIVYRLLFTDQRLDIFLNQNVEVPEAFKDSMQRCIAFRTLFSITDTFNSNFYVRMEKGHPRYAMSVNEPRMLIDQRSVFPSEKYLSKWLDGKDINDVIQTLLPQKDGESMVHTLTKLQNIVEQHVERVDGSYLWISSFLVGKLSKLFS